MSVRYEVGSFEDSPEEKGYMISDKKTGHIIARCGILGLKGLQTIVDLANRNSPEAKEDLQNDTQQLKNSISLVKSIRDDITGCAHYEQPGEATVKKVDAVIAKLESI